MDNEKRYSTRIKSERCDKIKISSVAAVFLVCSIAIFATRYRQDIWNFDRENGNDHQIENVATGSDASEEASEEAEDASEEAASEEAWEEVVPPQAARRETASIRARKETRRFFMVHTSI